MVILWYAAIIIYSIIIIKMGKKAMYISLGLGILLGLIFKLIAISIILVAPIVINYFLPFFPLFMGANKG